jgi:hypothetical protein
METRLLSRHGAFVERRHPIEVGGTLFVARTATGHQARVRVVSPQFKDDAGKKIGIEFLKHDNFWNLDWSSTLGRPPTTSLHGFFHKNCGLVRVHKFTFQVK